MSKARDLSEYPNVGLKQSDVINDLTTGGTEVPLSAEQGKVLDRNRKLTVVSSDPLPDPVLVRQVTMAGTRRGLLEYVVQDITITANSSTIIELPFVIVRGTYHVTGSIIAGTSDNTRVVGAEFSLNGYARSTNDSIFTIGDAFNSFTNQAGDGTYGNLLDAIELMNQNGNLSIHITNANSTISATNCTLFIRLITGEEP